VPAGKWSCFGGTQASPSGVPAVGPPRYRFLRAFSNIASNTNHRLAPAAGDTLAFGRRTGIDAMTARALMIQGAGSDAG